MTAGVTTLSTSRAGGSQRGVVAASLALLTLLALASAEQGGIRSALLAGVGFMAGFGLYHASFGFTSAWRNLLVSGRSRGVRAQILMIGATIVVFFPVLAQGSLFGQPVAGFVNPVGVALVVGALVFGAGMQLGGGCGSGTLYVAGGGSLRMLVTLSGFVAGSLVATANPLGWLDWPKIDGLSLVEAAGWPAALALTGVVLALAYVAASRLETARCGAVQPLSDNKPASMLHGPWPLLMGAFTLVLVNVATLALAGHPWGITSAFALWGAKIVALLGVPVSDWTYWRDSNALAASVFADTTSVMNVGIMLGALGAAGLAGRFAPFVRIPPASLASALLGGLMMGIGARLATGCNIGAFFSGLSSGSAHAVVWMVCAVTGSIVGIRWRRAFGLAD